MAAIATVLELLDHGAHVTGDDLYGGTYGLLEAVRGRSAGLTCSFVDLSDPAALAAAIRPESRMLLVETPTNPLLRLLDLRALAILARQHGLLAVADNTLASPWILQEALLHHAAKSSCSRMAVCSGTSTASKREAG